MDMQLDRDTRDAAGNGEGGAFDLTDVIAAFPHPDELPHRVPSAPPPDRDKALTTLRELIGDASSVSDNMRALTYLFTKAVCDDGANTHLTAASHLVIDCINSMADRLTALDQRAGAVYAPFVERRHG